ncbi:MAG: serine/threonine-protein phosphatase [Oscillospiraceae bacterium]|nr:serine/threonine-protein phosphatase [Oscillospiraceae bacterium]
MNRIETRNIKQYSQINRTLSVVKPFAVQTLYVLASLSLSNTEIFGGLSPLGIAFVAAVETQNLPAALLGSIAGYLIGNTSLGALRYIAAVAIAAIASFALKKVIGYTLPAVQAGLLSLGATLATGMAILFTGSVTVPNTALYLSEALIAGGATYFFKKTFETLQAKKSLKYIKPSLLTCVLMTFGFLLLSFSWLQIGGISVARVVACFVVLLAACYSKEFGGAIAGIASGISLSLTGGMGHLLSGYAAGGLLAGLFGQYGRFPAALCFMAANAVCAFTAQDTQMAALSIIETAIASVILIFMPAKLRQRAEEFFSPTMATPGGEGYKNMLRFKLSTAATAIGDITNSINAASRIINKLAASDQNAIFEAVQNDVCASCVRKSSCWDYNHEKSSEAFGAMAATLSAGEKLRKENIPNHFAGNCRKIDELLEHFEEKFREHTAKSNFEGKVSELRSVASEQFKAVSSMLENLTQEFTKDLIFNHDAADSAKVALESVGVNVGELFAFVDETGHMLVQALCGPRRRRVTNKAVTSALYDATGIEFDAPVVIEADSGQSMLLFCEKTSFQVTTGSSQYIGEGQRHCGDAFDYFLDGRGSYITLLSDGMGTGPRAAVDGSMTSSLSSRLVKAGFDYDSVLKTVNSALMVKSKEESLSTLDVLSVNLYSGEASFLKAGAAASFIYRDGKTMKIECASLPLGILKDVEFQRVSGKLQDGDIVITASDGAAPLSKEIITQELQEREDRSAGELAGALARQARNAGKNSKVDDITVIVSVFNAAKDA